MEKNTWIKPGLKKKKNDNERIELSGLKTCLNYPDLLKEIAVTLDTVLSSW